jgi:hypothetical protein
MTENLHYTIDCTIITGYYEGRHGKIIRAAYPKDYVVMFDNGTQTSFYENEISVTKEEINKIT